MLPAAGQGALGIEIRADQTELHTALASLTDRATWLAVHAERAVSRALGGSCSMPLAAYARWQGDTLQLDALLGHPLDPGQALIRASVGGKPADAAAADAMGLAAAEMLRSQGGAALLAALEPAT
jgi:hydroxymethylbilane synthase